MPCASPWPGLSPTRIYPTCEARKSGESELSPPTCLRCLQAQTNDRRARAARKQLRLGCLGRAATSWCSGWQPVGNWGYQPANFPASLLPVSRQRAEESRRAICAEKSQEAQAEQVPGVHVFSSQEGAETIPRDGVVFLWAIDALGPAKRWGGLPPDFFRGRGRALRGFL